MARDALLLKDREYDREVLVCPICGSSAGLHTVSVQAMPVGPEKLGVYMDGDGVTMVADSVSPKTSRGNTVRVTFGCEQGGHQFTVSFTFHKGDVLVSVEEEKDNSGPMDLWRD